MVKLFAIKLIIDRTPILSGSVPNVSYNVFASLHSAETIPSFPDDFFQVKPNSYYDIKYQVTELFLLQSPYATDCAKYFKDSPFRSNFDCYTNCEMAEHRKICSCLPEMWIYRADLLKRSDALCTKKDQSCYFDLVDDEEVSDEIRKKRLNMIIKCYRKCKVQCNQVEMRVSVFKWMDSNELFSIEENTSTLAIAPSKKKKVINRYKPAMNLANLVASIGGIGGFWIGLNVLGAYDVCVVLTKTLLAKLKTTNR